MIPTEIVDHILGLLHSDQAYTTLETCSVVFPQLVDSHLYSQITFKVNVLPQDFPGLIAVKPLRFTSENYVINPTIFSHILIQRPHVANYVRSVQILFIDRASELEAPGISHILSTLPRIESIMVMIRSPDYRFDWNRLGSRFCTAFQNILRLPSIRDVAISNFLGFSLRQFDDCKNLRNLLFRNVLFLEERASIPPYLRTCSLHIDCFDGLTKLVSWMKTNTPHTLSFCIHAGQSLHCDFRTLIEACSTSLVNLDVDFNQNVYSCHNHLIFPDLRLPLLDHIIFRFPVMSTFSSLVPYLRSIRTTSPVRLTLDLHLILYSHNAASLDWSVVSAILVLPVFRYPIELHVIDQFKRKDMDTLLVDVISSLEQNSEVKELLRAGKVAVIKGPSSYSFPSMLDVEDREFYF